MHLRTMEPARTSPLPTCLYIEGFSPGPGLPFPLLADCNMEVITTTMPYGVGDHLKNPFGWLLVGTIIATIWVSSSMYVWWLQVIVILTGGILLLLAKRMAVGYCLDQCMNEQRLMIELHKPGLIIGYSWGGGIACGLLNRGDWGGPTILIAPAGEQMWGHAGRASPTLRRGAIPSAAAVLTVHGDADAIVSLSESQRLHSDASAGQCRLIVAHDEDHFLVKTIKSSAILKWTRDLMDKTFD